MTKKEIRTIIERGWSLFGFEYEGKECSIDPYFSEETNRQEYNLYCDGKELIVFSVDEAMSTPFFCGKPLNEIYNTITAIDY